jgi:streptogramin lyase
LRLDAKSGHIYHFAGNGEKGYSGDGGDARTAKLSGPKGVACAPDGSLYIADTENHAIRRVDRSGKITTVAGTGKRGDGPDGDPLRTTLARPHGVFVDGRGIVYISDTENNRVRVLR